MNETLFFWIIGTLVGIGGGIMGVIFGHSMKTRDLVNKTTGSLSEHKLHVAENYLRKTDFERFEAANALRFDKVFDKLDKLQDTLDHKADK